MSHTLQSKWTRKGFSRAELVALAAIIATLIGLLLPAIHGMWRNHVARIQCIDNMKSIGLAMQNYHTTFGRFPVEGICTGTSFYISLLPYVHASDVYEMVAADYKKAVAADIEAFKPTFGYGNSTTGFVPTPPANILANYQRPIDIIQQAEPKIVVPAYLCPTRRGESVGPKVDYGGVFNVSIGDYPALALTATMEGYVCILARTPVPRPWLIPSSSKWLTVLDVRDPCYGPAAVGITTNNVANAAGTNNVIMLAHKGLAPINYRAPKTQYTGTITGATLPAISGTINDQGFATTAFTSYAAASNSVANPIAALYSTYTEKNLLGVDTAFYVYPPQLGYDHMRFADGGAYALARQPAPGDAIASPPVFVNPASVIPKQSTSYSFGYTQDSPLTSDWAMGGPHSGGSPVLMVDGSVRMYNYKYTEDYSGFMTNDAAVFQGLWAWNRFLPSIQPPDE
jgi:prepilin-type processing-associated H-X9-DG protein